MQNDVYQRNALIFQMKLINFFCKAISIHRLGYNLDWSVSNRLVFIEIARLPNSLLFSTARIYSAANIKLIRAQRNDSM